MGFWNEVKKAGKKTVKAVPSAIVGGIAGAPGGLPGILAGAAAGAAGSLFDQSSGGGGGGEGSPQMQALRNTLATAAVEQAPAVLQQLEVTNKALRDSRAAQEQSILSSALQIGAINAQQEAQIRAIAAQTGVALSDAMDQLLGEDGVAQVFSQIEQSVPEVIAQAATETERLVQETQELGAISSEIQSKFPDFLAQNADIAQRLQGVQRQNQQFVTAAAELTPFAQQNIETSVGIQDAFTDIGARAQTLGTEAGDFFTNLVAATEADLDAQDARELEQLKDALASQRISDGGALTASIRSLQDAQGRRRSTQVATVRQQAQAQQFAQQAQALGLETGAAGGQTTAAGTTGNLISGAAGAAGAGSGIVSGGAQQLGIESGVVGQGADFLTAQQDLINSGAAIINQQGRLIDTQTGRELQGADVISRAASQRAAAAVTGANLATTAGNVATNAATTGADLQRNTVAGQAAADQQVAAIAPGIESSVLANQQAVQRDLTQQSLTGTAADITASQRERERASEDRRATQQTLQTGIESIFKNGIQNPFTTPTPSRQREVTDPDSPFPAATGG